MAGTAYPGGIPAEPNLGETFVNGKDQETARQLLDAAEALGLDPMCVVAARGGFIVPNAVWDAVLASRSEAVAGVF